MTRTYNVISADGHLEIPPDDFLPYVAEAFRDQAPRRVQTPAGGDSWIVEGSPLIHTASNLTAGQPIVRHRSHWNPDGSRFPGTGDGSQRLREQDIDGLDAEVLYPPIFTLGGLRGISDPKAYVAIVQGYNTFLAESYCPVAPDRLIANGVIPERGIDGAISELERCARLGLKAVCLSAFPNGGPLAQPEDDRFWEAALTLGMPVTSHICFGAPYPPTVTGPQPGAAQDAIPLTSRQATLRPMWTVGQLMVAGVFDRFPELQLYFAETNASWLPTALQQLDENYKLYEHLYQKKLSKLPSEYILDHVFFGFLMDRTATRLLDLIPVGNLMWGTDFPHSVTSFPNSSAWLKEAFDGIDPQVRRTILAETPAKFFHLDTTAELTATPSA
jgi:predicted TIM-barrel fold metal-dependent hydrolase